MITLVLHSHMTKKDRQYKIERMYDFDELIKDFGPHIAAIVGEFKSIRPAAEAIVDYLSNHHMDVDLIDTEDHEEIYNPDIEQADKKSDNPKNAVDLKDVLETYNQAENVDIPDMHVMDAATHRWEK